MLSITLSSDFADPFLRNFADTYLLYKIVSICSFITNVPHGDNTYAFFHKKTSKHHILCDHEICFLHVDTYKEINFCLFSIYIDPNSLAASLNDEHTM